MSWSNPGLVKNWIAEGAITKYRIVKLGTADGRIAQAGASTDAIVGVAAELDAADGERIDVIHSGIAEVEFGGAVTRGALVTADAQGRAITAAPVAGTNARIVGTAIDSAAAGDIAPVLVVPSQIQG